MFISNLKVNQKKIIWPNITLIPFNASKITIGLNRKSVQKLMRHLISLDESAWMIYNVRFN